MRVSSLLRAFRSTTAVVEWHEEAECVKVACLFLEIGLQGDDELGYVEGAFLLFFKSLHVASEAP